MLARLIDKPHYLWRPAQVVRRLGYRTPPGDTVLLRLPWGMPIECFAGDAIASSIARTGVYDLLLTEAIFRLADAGETAVDVGANVGYSASALAAALGPEGEVLAVEPHPAVHALLARNAKRWAGARIELYPVALSSAHGTGRLAVGAKFASNRGTATLMPDQPRIAELPVPVGTLDEVAGERSIGVLKLDVEGHELEVLEGGRETLGSGRVRDILVEDRVGPRGPVTGLLREHGYTVFEMRQSLLGPRIGPRGKPAPGVDYLEPPSLLATLDPDRLLGRFRPRGWRALRKPRKRVGAPFVHRATRP
jgi:FkbM family methyltransferase